MKLTDSKTLSIPKLSDFVALDPFEHQNKAFDLAVRYRAFGFLMEQRTGKTLPAIGFLGWVKQHCTGDFRAVVIAPKGPITAWQLAFQQAIYPVELLVLDGEDGKTIVQRAQALLAQRSGIVLLNWDALNFEPIRKALERWKPVAIVVDESQRMKNPKTKRSKLLHKLGDQTEFKLILTGTPTPKDARDLWSQWRFLHSETFGKSYTDFEDRFVVLNNFMGWKKFRKIRNPKRLAMLVQRRSLRVLLKNCHDVPERHQTFGIKLKPATQKLHDDMLNEFVAELKDGRVAMTTGAGVAAIKAQQICGGFLKQKFDDGSTEVLHVGSEKLDVLLDWIEDFPNKLVIFCRYTAEINAICEAFEKTDISFAKMVGGTKNRGVLISNFQTKNDPRVLICQIQVGAEGIDLTAASTVVFFSMNSSWSDFDQARKRILGPNQKLSVDYIYFLCKNSIDEDVMEAVEKKEELADVVLNRLKFKRKLPDFQIPQIVAKVSKSPRMEKRGETCFRVVFSKNNKTVTRYRRTLDGAQKTAKANDGEVWIAEYVENEKTWKRL